MRRIGPTLQLRLRIAVVSKAAEQIVTERLDCYLPVGSCSGGVNVRVIKCDLLDVGARSLRRWLGTSPPSRTNSGRPP
jgi:hypothetical protein